MCARVSESVCVCVCCKLFFVFTFLANKYYRYFSLYEVRILRRKKSKNKKRGRMGQSRVLGKVNSKTRQPKEEEVAEVKVEVVDHV